MTVAVAIIGVAIGFFIWTRQPQPKAPERKFDRAFNAARAVQSSTVASPDYERFKQLLVDFDEEISAARAKAGREDEVRALDMLTEALAIYHDSLVLWKLALDNNGVIPLRDAPTQSIAAKYLVLRYRTPGTNEEFLRIEAVTVVWEKAQRQLQMAEEVRRKL
jgi:hypothetical protein